MIPLILAHGALGPYDELLFLAVAVVFVALMVIAWIRSRSGASGEDQGSTPNPDAPSGAVGSPPDDRPDHFPLA